MGDKADPNAAPISIMAMQVAVLNIREDILAEFAVLNRCASHALAAIANIVPDRRAFLSSILDQGTEDLRAQAFPDILPERREQFLSRVEAKWAELIATVHLEP